MMVVHDPSKATFEGTICFQKENRIPLVQEDSPYVGVPHGIDFTITANTVDSLTLHAPFFGLAGDYGNGPIFVKLADLFLTEHLKPEPLSVSATIPPDMQPEFDMLLVVLNAVQGFRYLKQAWILETALNLLLLRDEENDMS